RLPLARSFTALLLVICGREWAAALAVQLSAIGAVGMQRVSRAQRWSALIFNTVVTMIVTIGNTVAFYVSRFLLCAFASSAPPIIAAIVFVSGRLQVVHIACPLRLGSCLVPRSNVRVTRTAAVALRGHRFSMRRLIDHAPESRDAGNSSSRFAHFILRCDKRRAIAVAAH